MSERAAVPSSHSRPDGNFIANGEGVQLIGVAALSSVWALINDGAKKTNVA